MTDPAPEKCVVCVASPVEVVLFPVAIHYKGSGFYSTDYGKGAKKKEDSKPGDGKPAESKPATESKPASSSSSTSD
jgi:predicted nucleic acid-binding Zn ribbon protein